MAEQARRKVKFVGPKPFRLVSANINSYRRYGT
jgi:hypothetical protein